MPYIGPWEEFKLMRVMEVQEENISSGAMRAYEEGKGLRSSSYHFYPSPLCNGSNPSTLQKSSLTPSSCAVAPIPGIGDVFLYPFHLSFDRDNAGYLSSLPNAEGTQASFFITNKPSSTTSHDSTHQCSEQLLSTEVSHSMHSDKRHIPPSFSSFSCVLPKRCQNAVSVEKWRKAVNHDSNDLLDYLRGRRKERPPPSVVSQLNAAVHPTEVSAPHINPTSGKLRAKDIKKGGDAFSVTALDFQRLGHLASVRAARRCGFPYLSTIKPPRSSFDLSLDSFSGNVPSEIEIANRMQYRRMLQQLEQQQLCRTRMCKAEKEKAQFSKEMANLYDSLQSDREDEETGWISHELPDNSDACTLTPPCSSSSLSTSSTKGQKSELLPEPSFMCNGEESMSKLSPSVPLVEDDDEESAEWKNDFDALLDWAQNLDPSSI